MVLIILCIIFFSLWGYSLHQIKKLNLHVDKIDNNLKKQIYNNKILLEKLNEQNLKFIKSKIKEKFENIKLEKLQELELLILEKIEQETNINKEKISKEIEDFAFNKLETYKLKTDKNLNIKQKALVSGEFVKLRSDLNKDLDDLANRILNAKII